MKKKIFYVLLIAMLLPLNAASETSTIVVDEEVSKRVSPDVKITYPSNGEMVEGNVWVTVSAKGYNLRKPYLTIRGSKDSVRVQMNKCITASRPKGYPEVMTCYYEWNTKPFEGQTVVLTSTLRGRGGFDIDRVKVQVSKPIPPLPKVEITNPVHGEVVEGLVNVKLVAEGYKLKNPQMTIEGEELGIEFIMQECDVSYNIETGKERMTCYYEWDTKSFQGEDVSIIARVWDVNGEGIDRVKVNVAKPFIPAPKIEIVNPGDGKTVEGEVLIHVVASGIKVQDPYLAIYEDGGMMGFTMDCYTVYGKPDVKNCYYLWDTSPHIGEKITLRAEVKDLYDSNAHKVSVYVTGGVTPCSEEENSILC